MTHMQRNFNGIDILYAAADSFEEVKALPSKRIFCDEVCEFLNHLSAAIRKDKEACQYPDIVTFGFFCRRANIEQLKKRYNREGIRIGRGLAYHIAPSNVPINFAYTLVAGLLSGNANVVRVSTKDFGQTFILCRLIHAVIEELKLDIGKYIVICQYKREKEKTDYLSSLCDLRVVWGGDNTITEIRKSEIASRCIEIAFADRYSLAVFYAEDVLKIKDWEDISRRFFNDTYLYDQNACSSPRMIYWIGNKETIASAQELFWKKFHQFLKERYTIEPIIAVDKLTMGYRAAIDFEDAVFVEREDNLINRIKIGTLDKCVPLYACPGGSFLEYEDSSLERLFSIINKKYQTLAYLGGDGRAIALQVANAGCAGIDRVVPVGKTADFTLTWDGYDLVDIMSREVFVDTQ